MLLQMTVVPYMTVSLIAGVGRLGYDEARSILLRGGAVLVLLWALSLVIVLAIPLAFPDWEPAAFFSTSLVEEVPPIDFLRLYIPANPFHSMANTLVPAVVLFSIALGVALIGSENKRPIIQALDVLAEALMKLTGFVARLAPYGVFALSASAAGTMGFEDVGRIEVYLVTYALVALLMTFWLLPGLATVLTPLRYRQIVGRTRDALVTTAETGSAWTLLYADFSVVVPKGGQIKVPLAYAVSLESRDLLTLLNTWIDLRRRDGSIERRHDYWVRGLNAEKPGPRWSVIRNVLGWAD